MEEQFDLYSNYNEDRYIHFRYVPTGEYEIVESKRNGKIIHNRKPILEKQKLSFEDVKALNLDNYGQDVRTAAEDFTLIHNYLLDFWGAVMGSEAVMIYIHLKRYCYGGKDFCFPNMETIRRKMKKGSKATIIKYMDILEEHGFIAKINRIDKKRNNGFASPFFKVRRYIPLLSQDLIEQLPKEIQEEHDKFLARANGIDLDENFDPEVFINDLMKSSQVMKSNHQKDKEETLKQQGKMKEYILSQLSTEQQERWMMIQQDLESKISKPSFDVWIRDSIIVIDIEKQAVRIYCQNTFVVDWMRKSYKQMIVESIKDIFDIDIKHYECMQYEEYKQGDI
ncbi:DnaA N-terminal domain-containing protein [Oceanobacillus luteolus]|uniref:DnaA N-terminal domain-containing protein n=1 Tax=Oceanobacillus luteolus TaxID=1274358 RepID=A0ABW4HXD3_9BACI